MPIIDSFLDTDFYKLKMGQAVLQLYPDTWVKYKFKCRNDRIQIISGDLECLREEIRNLCSLRIKHDELLYLKRFKDFKPFYLEFLRILQLYPEYVKFWSEDGELRIEIEGPWMTTIYFEVPILAIVSEFFHKRRRPFNKLIALERLIEKILYLKENFNQNDKFKFADFGTRRRFSKNWQEEIMKYLSLYPNYFIGTSNVMFAKNYNIKPIGTQAHEWFQAHQQLGDKLINSQTKSLHNWTKVYPNDPGIALSDTLGFDYFLKGFNRWFSQHFDGCRQDSGDPIKWCNKLIDHYTKLDIDPKTKTAIFSDGLTFPEAVKLFKLFHERINCSFGIGTNLTNDVRTNLSNDIGNEPLQIVIKMVECNGMPVAKISDSPGKGMCEDESYLKHLKDYLKLKLNEKTENE